jgi:hypothetical protein
MFAVLVFDNNIDRIEFVILIEFEAVVVDGDFPAEALAELGGAVTKHGGSKKRAAVEVRRVDDLDHRALLIGIC